MRAPFFMLSLLTPAMTDSFQLPSSNNHKSKKLQGALHATNALDEQGNPKRSGGQPSSPVETPGARLAAEFSSFVDSGRLEDRWMQDVIKSRPRFLSYQGCRTWTQAQNMWTSKAEWTSWISMGEKTNSLIPSNPEEYYTARGTWVSWDDFLLGP